MNKKYQNGFFIFGLLVLIIMVTQLDFQEVWAGVRHAGYWFANAVSYTHLTLPTTPYV